MGNRMDIKKNEEGSTLEITDTVISNFKHHINLVDHSVSGLARDIDAMAVTCKILLQHVDKQDCTVEGTNAMNGTSQLVDHLLELINTSVSDHKFVAMESLSKFMNFVVELADNHTNSSDRKLLEFEIDKYMSRLTTPRARASLESHQSQIEKLLKENIEIKTAYGNEREKSRIESERNQLYVGEKKRLEKDNRELEKALRIVKEKLENETTAKEKRDNEHVIETDKLRITIGKLKRELENKKSDKDEKTEEHKNQQAKMSMKVKALGEDITNMKSQLDLVTEYLQKENNTLIEKCQTVLTEVTDGQQPIDTVFEEKLEAINVLESEIQKIKERFEKNKQLLMQNLENRADELEEYKRKMHLDQAIQILRKENEALKVNVNELHDEKEKLEDDLKRARESEFVPVQVYHPVTFRETKTEEDLLDSLKIKLDAINKNLKIVRLHKPSDVQPNIPLLIINARKYYTYTYYLRGSNSTCVLRDFDVSKSMALVTFHESHEIDETDVAAYYSTLGGIFNFKYTKPYQFDLDDSTIDKIRSFITRNDEKFSM